MSTQAPLITRADVLVHGAGSDFLDIFRVRPLEVQVQAAGALGAMSIAWRRLGQDNWSAPEPSEPGASWTWSLPDPAWASVTFAAGSYMVGDTWTIASSGAVTPQGGAPGTVTASRTDVVAMTIQGASDDFATWAQPRCVPPVLSIGTGETGWLACIVIYRLRSRDGLVPPDGGAGDDNLRKRAVDAESNIKAIGRSGNRPPSIVDSSPSAGGGGIPLLPRSRPPRGFGRF